ncbi:MAG TPA: PHP domain-containing protein [Sedimentisphaerales bacterium]|nr:PHP domain-containing protein [Sedimentisphaerales bacterium]
MITYDSHIHTAYCGHAEGMTTEAIIKQAQLKKLKTIIITDHVLNNDDLKKIDKIREEAASIKTSCNVIIGAEIDADGTRTDGKLVTDNLDNIDYVIGSIHYVPGVGNYPHSPEDCGLDPEELFKRWESTLLGVVSNPKVNTLAHPGRMIASILDFDSCFDDMLAVFSQAAKISAKNNIFWEINELNGDKLSDEYKLNWYKIYEAALDEGVGLIFGSDAHRIADIGKTTFTQKILRKLPADCLANPRDMGIVNV